MSKNYEERVYNPNKGAYYPQSFQPHAPCTGPTTGASPYPFVTPPNVGPQQTVPAGVPRPNISDLPGMLPIEQSYIENILRLNKGKHVKVYMTFENNTEWNAKIFQGRIEAAGRDHLILSEPNSGKRYLLLMIYLDYVEFDEPINYEYPYGAATQDGMLSQYAPR